MTRRERTSNRPTRPENRGENRGPEGPGPRAVAHQRETAHRSLRFHSRRAAATRWTRESLKPDKAPAKALSYPEAGLRLLYRGDETVEIDGIRCLRCDAFLRRLVPGQPLP